MPPPKQWDDEDSDESTPPSSPPLGAAASRRKFDDEEDDDDVLDSWDAADDSEAEREKAKKAEEAKAKAAAAAAAAKKPKSQRVAQHQAERARKKAEVEEEEEEEEEEETEAERRERLRRAQVDADLDHAADLFGDVGISAGRAKARPTAVVIDDKEPHNTVDIAKLPIFNPQTKLQFDKLRNTLTPIISANNKKAHYSLFLQDFAKGLAKDMPSEQIKKLASALTALGNEKMREEKAAEKGGKKTKAAKTKTSLVTGNRNATVDAMGAYDGGDDFGDDDFM